MKTIMVVDDELSVLEEIKSFLDDNSFKVIAAQNSREALELMNEKDIDLVLIDTVIPDGSKTGFFCTFSCNRSNIENASNYLSKPFTKDEFIDFLTKKL
jgi:DNA-binding response OmpR family regulator